MYKPPSTAAGEEPIGVVSDADALAIVQTRCVMCHAEKPNYPGFYAAPKGLVLETQAHLEQNAAIVASSIASKYMPLANLSKITDRERAQIAKWFANHKH